MSEIGTSKCGVATTQRCMTTVYRIIPKRGRPDADQIGGGVAGEELGVPDDRVMQSVTAGGKLSCPPKMVNEDVGIDEDISHDRIRPD